jgi:uncharacterized membrane protein
MAKTKRELIKELEALDCPDNTDVLIDESYELAPYVEDAHIEYYEDVPYIVLRNY